MVEGLPNMLENPGSISSTVLQKTKFKNDTSVG